MTSRDERRLGEPDLQALVPASPPPADRARRPRSARRERTALVRGSGAAPFVVVVLVSVLAANVPVSLLPSFLPVDLEFDATIETRAIGFRLESDWALPEPMPERGRRVVLRNVRLVPEAPTTGPLAGWLAREDGEDADVESLRVRPPDDGAPTSARLQTLSLPAGSYLRVELSRDATLQLRPCGDFAGEVQLLGALRLAESGPRGTRDGTLELALTETIGLRRAELSRADCPDARATIEIDRPAGSEAALGALRFDRFDLYRKSGDTARSAVRGGEIELARTGRRVALVPGDELGLDDDARGAVRSWHVDGERGVIVAHVTGRTRTIALTTTSTDSPRGTRELTPSVLAYVMSFPLGAMMAGWLGIGSLGPLFRRFVSVLGAVKEKP